MKNSKAAGPNNIPVEVWKSLGEEGIDILCDLTQKIFNQEKMPEKWKRSLIIPICKEKGDIQECGNYRGVEKLSDRIQESRLRWYGHVMRRDEQYIGRIVIEVEVQGTRRRGRPKRRWVDCIQDDL
ncbi:uncharacterized protein [Palaemon carinicauda]|uniref:uncharacterized protein n=1 Tax=Palaemon carinicauda TaxID=392227 RepID=UPI0035B62213